MRILVNFQLREIWTVHCLADDYRTPVSPFVQVESEETLIRLLRYVGGGDAEIEEVRTNIRRWSRGSVAIDLVAGRKNLLRIREPWSAELE
jgi:hypothetical protein